jgi:glycerate 2-kinase
MKILIAVDSFKGTLSSIQASKIIGKEFELRGNDVRIIPIADGGEGTIDAIFYSIGGKKKFISVPNPRGKKIRTYYLQKNKTAYLEYAKTSGLMLLKKSELNPLKASSYGFGEMIKSVLEKNIDKIVIGIGGSATNDVGIGMLSVLGVKFYDKKGFIININDSTGAEVLDKIYDFDISGIDKKIFNINIEALCDVKNPLYGINSTSNIYSAQKGADEECVKKLEKSVKHFSNVIEKKLNIRTNFPGSGAAGGIGAALKIFLNAKIVNGINGIIDLLDIEKNIINSDLVITGEGSMDFQSSFGKAPVGIAKLAKRHNKKVIAICGKTDKNVKELFKEGFDFIFSYYGDEVLSTFELKRNAHKTLRLTAQFATDIIAKNDNLKNKVFIINET